MKNDYNNCKILDNLVCIDVDLFFKRSTVYVILEAIARYSINVTLFQVETVIFR